ncbi:MULTISPECIES: hypothetical protein [Halorussus]|uniref:hypothetical protein n=1 Tax=Halorussus TaxID=1070314 RepID=UPI00209D6EC5|nr:hypothetical protein [Halorussus vallis]USZ77078.1 hypothetical protein NGM07_07060 [Halorussus vallis]
MPGISLVSGSGVPEAAASSALDAVRFTDEYDAQTAISDGRTFLGFSGYPDYPVRTVETPEALFVLEGRLYDAEDERRDLRTVGTALLDGRTEEVAAWAGARDGDFLLVAYEKDTGAVRIVNDVFARLPVYYATVGDAIVVSRELKFVRDFAHHVGDAPDMDRLAVAQSLLFGYRLGDRTLFESVRRVPPGSALHVEDDAHGGEFGVRVDRLHRHDFEGTPHANRSVGENAAELASRFAEACADRDVPGVPNVVSMSGGLDSRAVGGGYDAAGVDFTAATFEKPGGANDADVRLARETAGVLDVDWEHYRAEGSEAHRADLLEMKQGMNFLAMSFILDFFEQLRDAHGPLVYVTGDGGDKALPDITAPRSFSSRRDLAEYVVDAHSIFDPERAAAIAGLDPEALVDAVETRLASYPESSYQGKYVHFLVRERGINWLNHGEDRNRYYFWSVSPFYSPRFFRYAMGVPAAQKTGSKLQAAFLDELDPALCAVDDANYGAPVTSLEHRAKQFAAGLVCRYPAVKRTVAGLLGGGGSPEGLDDAIVAQLRRADRTPFADEAVASVLRGEGDYGARELYNLLTVAAIADREPDEVVEDVAPRLVA